mgnify:CR=1 FL=1
MVYNSYDQFFQTATKLQPYDYQRRLATAVDLPRLINVPTGAGKTASVVLGWLWRRMGGMGSEVQQKTPRRLIYCLPMRTLVEQTHGNVQYYLQNLSLQSANPDQPGYIGLCTIMGGSNSDDWVMYPESDAIIIGTQDMLLSRALNRGYGTSRFQWPFLFGLINNDCLWVMDEIQLMGSGLATSAQLEAFRKSFGVRGSAQTIWMSATAEPEWLKTVDHSIPYPEDVLTLSDSDHSGSLSQRLSAKKILQRCPVSLEGSKEKALPKNATKLTHEIISHHVPGTLTLVIINSVKKAKIVFEALQAIKEKGQIKAEIMLVHSRFRAYERKCLNEQLTQNIDSDGPGLIAVTTQVVEAGVDISARTLYTELAPWASVVQRLGRLNRFGKYPCAEGWWIDVSDKDELPYTREELATARDILMDLEGQSVAPNDLPSVNLPYDPRNVIRKRDLLELFDTASDLSGNDIDVSRFIRDGEEIDVHIFWRDWDSELPTQALGVPLREELCPVSVWDAKEFIEKNDCRLYCWDYLDKRWLAVRSYEIYPGQVLLAKAIAGGYDSKVGWNADSLEAVKIIETAENQKPEQGIGDDFSALDSGVWLTIAEHSDHVAALLEILLKELEPFLQPGEAKSLRLAARYHDAGKSHEIFQDTMLRGLSHEERAERQKQYWAKRKGGSRHHNRPYFRHELASALAVIAKGLDDLTAYLCAAHHGKVRLSLRSLPKEKAPDKPGMRYAFGVWEGDTIPNQALQVDLGDGTTLQSIPMQLDIMELGLTQSNQKSWTERMLALRNLSEMGPFRMAYLEALIAACDRRASAAEEEGAI